MADAPELPLELPLGAVPVPADNLLEFRRREPGDDEALAALARAPRDPKPCPHTKRVIDETLRTVTCRTCGVVLDPIWCLLTLVDYREHLRRERAALDAEKARAAERRDAAFKRRQKRDARRAMAKARDNCRVCAGSGWALDQHNRAVRCRCRSGTGALL